MARQRRRVISKVKLELEAAVKVVKGTARSMGVRVSD